MTCEPSLARSRLEQLPVNPFCPRQVIAIACDIAVTFIRLVEQAKEVNYLYVRHDIMFLKRRHRQRPSDDYTPLVTTPHTACEQHHVRSSLSTDAGDQIRSQKQAEQRSTINPSPLPSITCRRTLRGLPGLVSPWLPFKDAPRRSPLVFPSRPSPSASFPKTSFPSAVQPCRGCFDAIIIHSLSGHAFAYTTTTGKRELVLPVHSPGPWEHDTDLPLKPI
ncbi:hypothetical protein H109_07386 [Trichophyton interdigitale MR816]|uniref:Uncharacterized protein n=1 Tax=Trichophyton interdigitale (strain MR816) TaxID=1215338 RepID=A0A059IYV9_TRIIM|nr:hypothetical protein H109_07386 [Trichophyton interdigitale MR816]